MILDIGKNLSQLSEKPKKQAGFDNKEEIVSIIKKVSGISIISDNINIKDTTYTIKVSGSKKIKILLYKDVIQDQIRSQLKLTTLVL